MTKQNFKTPIKDILFRSSKIGLLAGGLIGHGLTEKQREEMDKFELDKKTPMGLSEKQQADLDGWNAKAKEGATLSATQMEKRDDFKTRLKKPKGITPIQEVKLHELFMATVQLLGKLIIKKTRIIIFSLLSVILLECLYKSQLVFRFEFRLNLL